MMGHEKQKHILTAVWHGTTMVEILFVILLSAVVLMIVWDGALLFGRYSSNMMSRITSNSMFFNDYSRLEGLIASADSMQYHYWNSTLELHRTDLPNAMISQADSSVIVVLGGRIDTLFRSRAVFSPVCNDPKLDRVDTLVVRIARNEKTPLRIAFAPRRQFHREAREKLSRQEKNFRYD